MNNLFLSFAIAIGGAVGLVTFSNAYNVESVTNKVLPLIPILYALVYQVLEKAATGKAKPIPPDKNVQVMKDGAAKLFRGTSVERIVYGIGISLAIKLCLELAYTALFIRFAGQSFTDLYGGFSIETMARFMRGDHPWLSGTEGLALLAVIAFSTSFGTGIWIGRTTQAEAILEGVIVGALVTLLTTMTNLIILYRKLEEMTVQAADSMGYVTHVGFVVVITLQVLFYGLWSGLTQKNRRKQLARLQERKPSRKSR